MSMKSGISYSNKSFRLDKSREAGVIDIDLVLLAGHNTPASTQRTYQDSFYSYSLASQKDPRISETLVSF